MKKLLLSFVLFTSLSVAFTQELTEHTVVDESRLLNGTRIQINVEVANLSKADCSTLIDAYRSRAGADGQVSVHKPSTLEGLNRAILPFCVDNLDGSSISFDTTFHPNAK